MVENGITGVDIDYIFGVKNLTPLQPYQALKPDWPLQPPAFQAAEEMIHLISGTRLSSQIRPEDGRSLVY